MTAIPSTCVSREIPGAFSFKETVSYTSHSTNHSSANLVDPMIEGESSATAQSTFAEEFLHKSVVINDSTPEMHDTLEALHSLVEAVNQQPSAGEMIYPHARTTSQPSFEEYEMPPVHSAVNLIREAKGTFFCQDTCHGTRPATPSGSTDMVGAKNKEFSVFSQYVA